MDERKKTIKDLEDQKKADLASMDALLIRLGESLLPRMREEVSEYRVLLQDKSDSGESIKAAEADIARLKQLEEDIRKGEQDSSEQSKGISRLYTRIGELVLLNPEFEEFAAPYRVQAETLMPKIQSLESRLEVLDGQENPNVFAWIGKNAQGMVLRTFLSKNKNNLQRIFFAAGEKYVQGVDVFASEEATPVIASAPVLETLDEIGASRKLQAAVQARLVLLREERRRITDAFTPDGGPVKKIQSLERHIAGVQEQLRALFLRYGKLASEQPEQPSITPLLESGERELLDRIAVLKSTVAENERRIEKLKASLAIDEEKARIDKMGRSIADHRRRIAESENTIGDLTAQIEEANARIEELSKVLD
jgi:chromosome segregation ATPase